MCSKVSTGVTCQLNLISNLSKSERDGVHWMVERITKSEVNERRENGIHWLTEMLDPNVRWVRCKGGG